MKIRLPETVKIILDALRAAGFEAWAVGGCVRDSVLGREPDDWDVTTSALPEQIKKTFRRTVDTGIEHGTVTVLIKDCAHEVTTYRVDGNYSDARHPDKVEFTSSLEEDLKRRDFTINAMAYNEEQGLVDLYGGQEDLKKGLIRCVGDPEDRFSEDALRILRAVRFGAQLHFRIEENTLEAVGRLADTLRKISAERICTELVKMITSPHPEYLRLAYETGVTKVVLPEFDRLMETPQNTPHHCFTVGEHTIRALCGISADRVLRLAVLLHDIAKPSFRTTDENGEDHFKGHALAGAEEAEKILRRLRMDNDTIRQVKTLVRYHDWRVEPAEKNVRRAMHAVGEELFPALLAVQTADILAQSEWYREEKLERIRQVEGLMRKILEERQCISLKDLAVGGNDLLALGVPKGPEVGRLLNLALEEVLEEPARNTREYLMDFLRGNQ